MKKTLLVCSTLALTLATSHGSARDDVNIAPVVLTNSEMDSVTAGLAAELTLGAIYLSSLIASCPQCAEDVVSGTIGYVTDKSANGFLWTGDERTPPNLDTTITGTALRTVIDGPVNAVYGTLGALGDIIRYTRGDYVIPDNIGDNWSNVAGSTPSILLPASDMWY